MTGTGKLVHNGTTSNNCGVLSQENKSSSAISAPSAGPLKHEQVGDLMSHHGNSVLVQWSVLKLKGELLRLISAIGKRSEPSNISWHVNI